MPAWSTVPGAAEAVAATHEAVGARVAIGAYVTVLPPASAEELPAHVRRLRAAGADELHVYHLGLAPAHRLALIEDL